MKINMISHEHADTAPARRRRPGLVLAAAASIAVLAGSVAPTPHAAALIDVPKTPAVPGPPPVRSFPDAGPVAPPATAIASPVTPSAHCGNWYRQSSYAGQATGTTWWEYGCSLSECEGYCNLDATYASWTDYYHWDGSQAAFHAEYETPHLDGWIEDGCWYWWDAAGAGTWYELACTQSPPPDNASPTASFTVDCTGLTCTFDAGTSTDPDGDVVSHIWDFGDGQRTPYFGAGTSPTVQHTYLTPGDKTAYLTVVDDVGGSGWTERFFHAADGPTEPNIAPTARFTVRCADLDCSFDATGSSDPDGTIMAHDWQFGDGDTGRGPGLQRRYAQPGTYVVTLTVTDNYGATDSATATVALPAVNGAPTAAFTIDCTGLSCVFDGQGSTDPDGVIVRYRWDSGDLAIGNRAVVQPTYPQTGSYTVTLTVTDDRDATGNQAAGVAVTAPTTTTTEPPTTTTTTTTAPPTTTTTTTTTTASTTTTTTTTAPPTTTTTTAPAGTVPSAPQSVTARPIGTTAEVRFTAPSSDGGSPITGHTARCASSNGGITRQAQGAASPVNVPSLSPGKTYTCTVRATNAIGTGPPSTPTTSFRVPK
jgi:PKD repeat protein